VIENCRNSAHFGAAVWDGKRMHTLEGFQSADAAEASAVDLINMLSAIAGGANGGAAEPSPRMIYGGGYADGEDGEDGGGVSAGVAWNTRAAAAALPCTAPSVARCTSAAVHASGPPLLSRSHPSLFHPLTPSPRHPRPSALKLGRPCKTQRLGSDSEAALSDDQEGDVRPSVAADC